MTLEQTGFFEIKINVLFLRHREITANESILCFTNKCVFTEINSTMTTLSLNVSLNLPRTNFEKAAIQPVRDRQYVNLLNQEISGDSRLLPWLLFLWLVIRQRNKLFLRKAGIDFRIR